MKDNWENPQLYGLPDPGGFSYMFLSEASSQQFKITLTSAEHVLTPAVQKHIPTLKQVRNKRWWYDEYKINATECYVTPILSLYVILSIHLNFFNCKDF